MDRVRVVRFRCGSAAGLAADFLRRQGFDADFTDHSGKGPSLAYVLVARHQAGAAYDLLRRVSRGDFASGVPDAEDPYLSEVAVELSLAIRGTDYIGATPAWLNILPIPLVALGLVLLAVLQIVSAPIRDWVAYQMGW